MIWLLLCNRAQPASLPHKAVFIYNINTYLPHCIIACTHHHQSTSFIMLTPHDVLDKHRVTSMPWRLPDRTARHCRTRHLHGSQTWLPVISMAEWQQVQPVSQHLFNLKQVHGVTMWYIVRLLVSNEYIHFVVSHETTLSMHRCLAFRQIINKHRIVTCLNDAWKQMPCLNHACRQISSLINFCLPNKWMLLGTAASSAIVY